MGRHTIVFNRGVAASQAYSRRFGNRRPDKIEDKKLREAAFKWLSRGLEEAIVDFIGQAKSNKFALRAAVYEFSHLPVLKAFGKAAKKADVKIIYDRRKGGPFEASEKAVKKARIKGLMKRRETNSAIAHNKFIVLLKNGKPVEVFTGSTNMTAGGIYGQSNVGHIIRDEDVAQQYLDFWNRLNRDPEYKDLRPANVAATPDPVGAPPANSVTPFFSPRSDLTLLEWYAERMKAATDFVGFTAAFGISRTISPVLLEERDYARYLIVESEGSKRTPKKKPGEPQKKSPFDIFQKIRKTTNNKIARGASLRKNNDAVGNQLHRWLDEQLTGLNGHVKYVHTKYLILDAMTADPVVISGSANFSKASTDSNDENMVVIRGDTDVADAFVGEFMRLFNHFYFRDVVQRQTSEDAGEKPVRSSHLVGDDSWTDRYFEPGSIKALERKLFA